MPRSFVPRSERSAESAFGFGAGPFNLGLNAAGRFDFGADAAIDSDRDPFFDLGEPDARPDLSASGRVESDEAFAPGNELTLEVTTRNDGDGDLGRSFGLTYYLSDDAELDGEDTRLGEDREGPLDAGETGDERLSFELPATAGTGSQVVLIESDPSDAVAESDETNNVAPVRFDTTALGRPDLVSTGRVAEAERGAVEAGTAVALTVEVTNRGDRATDSGVDLRYWLSTDRDVDLTDVALGEDRQSALDGGETGTETARLSLPDDLVSGQYFVLIETDTGDEVPERDEANNLTPVPVEVVTAGRAKPDLASFVSVAPEDGGIAAGADLELSVVTRNQGNADTDGRFELAVFLSDDPGLEPGDRRLADEGAGSLEAGESDDEDIDVELPENVTPQGRYLLVATDVDGEVREADESNNVAAVDLATAGGAGVPDLVPSIDVRATDTRGADDAFVPGEGVPITGDLTNAGGAATDRSATTRFHVSRNDTLEPGRDVPLTDRDVEALAPGQSAPLDTRAFLPGTVAGGEAFILAEADATGEVAESAEANNVAAAPIRIDADDTFGFG